MPSHTFNSAGRLSDSDQFDGFFTQSEPVAILRIGSVSSDTLGSSLKIMVKTEDGDRHVIREITALAELQDNTVRLTQPGGSQIDLEVEGSPSLYVEFKQFRDDDAQR